MNKTLLKNKNYMLLVIGNFVSLLGSNIQQFVLSLYVLSITGSATIFASMLAISILPRLLLSPVAGVFGDWFDKKKVIVTLDMMNACLLFGFSYLIFLQGEVSIALIYGVVVILEVIEIFFGSSMAAVMPSIVDENQYLEANSLRMTLVSFGQLMGPVIGALLFSTFGLLIAVMINATSFLLSAISELFIDIPKIKNQVKKSVSSFKKDFVEGLKIIKQLKTLKVVIALAIIVNFSVAPFFSVGLIFLVREVLHQSDVQLGFVQTVLSASTMITPILVTKKLKNVKFGSALIALFMSTGLVIMLFSITINQSIYMVKDGILSYAIVLILCFLVGVFITSINILTQTVFQKTVPLEFMGRVGTTLTVVATIAMPLGQVLFGYLYDIINPGLVVIINGAIVVLGVMIYYQKMKAIDEPSDDKVEKVSIESGALVHEV